MGKFRAALPDLSKAIELKPDFLAVSPILPLPLPTPLQPAHSSKARPQGEAWSLHPAGGALCGCQHAPPQQGYSPHQGPVSTPVPQTQREPGCPGPSPPSRTQVSTPTTTKLNPGALLRGGLGGRGEDCGQASMSWRNPRQKWCPLQSKARCPHPQSAPV